MNEQRPKKSLGQNFLKDKEVLRKIVEAADLGSDDNVLEIGPGRGALTRYLSKGGARILAIEKDENLAGELEHQLKVKSKKLKVVEGDVLEINLPALIEENDFQDYKVVANIPYYITGKIIRLLFETKHPAKLIVLLVQKEVAQRICSAVGKMSILAVSVQVFGKPEIIDLVPKESFEPVPKVDSAILQIVPHKRPLGPPLKKGEDEKDFFKIVKIGFASRRKTLLNNLVAGLSTSKEATKTVLESCAIDGEARAQSLSVQDWKKLSQKIHVAKSENLL